MNGIVGQWTNRFPGFISVSYCMHICMHKDSTLSAVCNIPVFRCSFCIQKITIEQIFSIYALNRKVMLKMASVFSLLDSLLPQKRQVQQGSGPLVKNRNCTVLLCPTHFRSLWSEMINLETKGNKYKELFWRRVFETAFYKFHNAEFLSQDSFLTSLKICCYFCHEEIKFACLIIMPWNMELLQKINFQKSLLCHLGNARFNTSYFLESVNRVICSHFQKSCVNNVQKSFEIFLCYLSLCINKI